MEKEKRRKPKMQIFTVTQPVQAITEEDINHVETGNVPATGPVQRLRDMVNGILQRFISR